MKKIPLLLFAYSIFVSVNVFSQVEYAITVEDLDGNSLSDNQILQFDTLEYPDASFTYKVRNNTSETIRVRVEVESFSGTDGTMMELCFGECYFGVTQGQSYPINNAQPFVYIGPGETQIADGDHFFNSDPGDGNIPVEYTFRFYISDENGDGVVSQAELQTDYTIGYYYSSTLSVTDVNDTNFQISYNSKLLNIISPTDCKLEIFDIQGKLVNTHELNFGVNSIFNQNLEGKVFIFKFQFSDGNHHFKKFIF
jgi:hypothetical protein|tara:strand:- start:420 stop:1178 length:759 start_codon:yes stop_codon:yes gene_type:complete